MLDIWYPWRQQTFVPVFMKYFYINSRLNNGLAAVALSVAAHVRVHGIPLRVYCVGVRARMCRYSVVVGSGSCHKILVWLTTPT